MDKPNTFRSSNFYMSAGDVLHMIIRDESGTAISVELYGLADPNNAEDVGYGQLVDYDGNVYTEITIGTQKWLVENLITTHYADGTLIPEITDQDTWNADTDGARCWYNNDEATYGDYGLLYNWYAVDNTKELCYFERDGVQDTGWRIPTKTDWEILFNYLGGLWYYSGGKLKETGTDHWLSPNTHATDEYGFKLLGNGDRGSSFIYNKENSYLWASTDYTANFAYYMRSLYAYGEFYITYGSKHSGRGVRCVKNLSVFVTVSISVDATPGFEISDEVGYAVVGEDTVRITFMCDAFPVAGGGGFGILIQDAGSNTLYNIDAVDSSFLAQEGVTFDSNDYVEFEDGLPLSRPLVVGDVLTVTLSGALA